MKKAIKHIVFILLLVLITGIVINVSLKSSNFPSNIKFLIYFFGFTLVILLYLFIYFSYKLFFAPYKVKRAGKFQTRLFLYFLLTALIPVIPLLIVTQGLINRSIEIWVKESIAEALKTSLKLTSNLLEEHKQDVVHFAYILRNKPYILNVIRYKDAEDYKNRISKDILKFRLDFLFLYTAKPKRILNLQYNYVLKKHPDLNTVRNSLKGREYLFVQNEGKKNFVIYYLPVIDKINHRVIGVLVTGKFLPDNFNQKANLIGYSYQSYKQMLLYKKPLIKGLTTTVIIILTIIILLVAMIVSYFSSRLITEPIQVLLDATKRIARGELNFQINYKARDEIKLLINAFNHMTKELYASKQALYYSQRIAAWREVARRIAHEIKNPLTPIKLSAERLKLKYNSPDFEKILKRNTDTIIREVERLEELVKEFAEFAKAPQINPEVVNLNHLILETLTLYENIESIKFQTELAQNLPPISVDKQRIKEVLINLINNSIDAIRNSQKQDGRIVVRSFIKNTMFGNSIIVEVEDNGGGIPPEYETRIFDPEFTTKKEGTGLGLYLVEKIISEHGARVRVVNNPGVGAKFILEFPL